MSIVIVDYGTSNLRSVQKAVQSLGFSSIITQNKTEILNAHGVILPGVGSFDSCITELRNKNLEEPILQYITSGKPFLGICMGLQMLFSESEEGKEKGLSVLDGKVEKFKFKDTPLSNLKIPHMGWNRILIKKESPVMAQINNGDMFYFVHSYYVAPKDENIILTTTDYGIPFVSSINKGNLFGTQFHPEKSGDKGMLFLKNFLTVCKKGWTNV